MTLASAAGILGLAGAARADLVFYEGFNYAAGDLHNSNNTTIVPAGDVWTRAGTVAATSIDVTAGSLTSPVGTPTGNKATLIAPATASTERLNFTGINSGSVWYSMTFNATIGTENPNNTTGAYFAGLSSFDDNSDVDSGSPPAITNTAARLALRRDTVDPNKLNVALTNTVAQSAASYSPVQLTQGTDVFVIVSYDILAGAANDVAKLWVNPNAATFDPATTSPTLTVANQSPDIIDIKSFFLRQSGGLPQFVNVDEVRLGNSFLDVTPQTYYWDVNGSSPGPGSTTPGGSWDGTENNFNRDAGGGSGLFVGDPHAWDTVVFSAGGSAFNAFTVDVSGTRTASTAKFEEGDVTFNGGTLAVGAFDVAEDASARVQSVLAGGTTGGVTKIGVGTLTLAAANTYAGGTTVTGGTLVAADADALGAGGLTVNNATAQAEAGLPKALSVSTLTTTGTGKLDLTDNDLVIKTSTLAAVQAQITAGFNGGTWDGAGINSSAAATDPNATTALGYGDNAELGLTTFSGVTLTGNEILVKYTYYGDADLTGVVDLDDFGLFLTGYQNGSLPRTWIYGDFDYTGVIDLDDFGLFLYGYQNQGGPLSALAEAVAEASGISSTDRASMQAAIAAVPEPSAALAVGVSVFGIGLVRRRPRRSVIAR